MANWTQWQKVVVRVLDTATNKYKDWDWTLSTWDIEIGAVELKDGATDARWKIKTDGVDNAIVVIQNSQPLPVGAATSAKQDALISAVGNLSIVIDNETPGGSINNINVNFTTYYNYKPGTTKIWLNGIRQREGIGYDYIENGTNSIVYGSPPMVGDTLTIDYTKL